jgi:hypothetical protein
MKNHFKRWLTVFLVFVPLAVLATSQLSSEEDLPQASETTQIDEPKPVLPPLFPPLESSGETTQPPTETPVRGVIPLEESQSGAESELPAPPTVTPVITQKKATPTKPASQRTRDVADSFWKNKTSSRKGPDGGNKACAWIVSWILRQAGVVPAKWNENNAPRLSNTLLKQGWKKVPFNPNRPIASQLKKGDIILWSPDHVGVYDEGKYCYSNSSRYARLQRHPVLGYGPWKKVVQVIRLPDSGK